MKRSRFESSKSSEKAYLQNPIGAYAVQCGKCFKWRLIPTVEEYEDIRVKFIEDPWFCDKRSNISCEDPSDLEFDDNRFWIIDKPNIPKTPKDFERGLSVRKDFSRIDPYYVTPNGKKVRAPANVEKFLEENPRYKDAGVSVSDFNFAAPKILDNMTPASKREKRFSSAGKKLELIETNEE